jgi:hypothetical protein
MNCDDAFEAMTDLSGDRNAALESHLSRCRRCRQMQDTLSPALTGLRDLHPSRHDEPSRRKSSTAPALLSPVALQLIDLAVAQRQSLRRRASPWAQLGWWQPMSLVAAFLIGLGMGATQAGSDRPVVDDASSAQPLAMMAWEPCTWKQRDRSPAPMASQLVAACVECHVPQPGWQ